ncbi:hypothetical protein GCM10025859_32320 [Alicyclobacillus fastidiosus]|nr:hypothetical protein GCM10025859_32320 [Alicyclobacillus fastidiosus]
MFIDIKYVVAAFPAINTPSTHRTAVTREDNAMRFFLTLEFPLIYDAYNDFEISR